MNHVIGKTEKNIFKKQKKDEKRRKMLISSLGYYSTISGQGLGPLVMKISEEKAEKAGESCGESWRKWNEMGDVR